MRRAIILFVVACSSGEPPVVHDVTFGPFSPDADGNETAVGTVTTSGNDITQLRVRFDPESQDGVTFWEGPPLDVTGKSSPYTVTLAIRASVPASTYSLRVTATDSTGASSDPFAVDVVLP